MRSRVILRVTAWLVFAFALYVVAHVALAAVASRANRSPPTTQTPDLWGLDYEELIVTGPLSNSIPVWLIPGEPDHGIVVVVSCNSSNRAGDFSRWTAGFLQKAGFSCALFDTRGQGDSEGLKTYGVGEALDISAVTDELAALHPQKRIGAIGFSLGAASILRALGVNTELACAVSFASYSKLDGALIRQELSYQTGGRWHGTGLLTGFLATAFRVWARPGQRVPEPVDALRTSRVPVLIIHFTGDPEIPFTHAKQLYTASDHRHVELHSYQQNRHLPWDRSDQFAFDFERRVVRFFLENL